MLNKSTPAHAWIIGLMFVGFASQSEADSFDYAPLNRVLGRVVTQGGVDTRPQKQIRISGFCHPVGRGSVPPIHIHTFSPIARTALAFWINAYTPVVTLQGSTSLSAFCACTDRPLLAFFKIYPICKVGGRRVTLDHIEHEIFPSSLHPSIHAAFIAQQ